MSNEEINSAELEAEEILKSAYSKAQAEECPQGEECPVHFRVNDVYFEPDSQYARIITYLGEYAVVTEDNHELDNPILMIRIMLGKVRKEDLPPRWETTIIVVGEGSLGELSERSIEERRQALRYVETHDEWEGLQDTHNIIVSALESGFIDVSKPLEI